MATSHLLLDSGNTFHDAISAERVKDLIAKGLNIIRKPLPKTYKVVSASGHIMEISEYISIIISIPTNDGLTFTFLCDAVIIPGSNSTPINICYQTLVKLKLLDFSEALSKLSSNSSSPIDARFPFISSIIPTQSDIIKNIVNSACRGKLIHPSGDITHFIPDDTDEFNEIGDDPDAPPDNSTNSAERIQNMKQLLAEKMQQISPDKSGLDPEIYKSACKLVNDYADVFRSKANDEPPMNVDAYSVQGRVNLNVDPSIAGPRKLNQYQLAYEKLYLHNQLQSNRFSYFTIDNVEENVPIVMSPAFFVPKPGAGVPDSPEQVTRDHFRPVADCRLANDLIIKRYKFPPVSDQFFATIMRSHIFMSLDLQDAYGQLPLASRHFFTHCFSIGPLLPNRVVQGTTDAGAWLQNIIQSIFGPRHNNWKTVLDDLLFHGSSDAEWLEHLTWVLRTARHFNMFFNISKFVPYLNTRFTPSSFIRFNGGHWSENKYQNLPRHFLDLNKLKVPLNAAALYGLIGAANYMRFCIPNYIRRIQPLWSLLRKVIKSTGAVKKLALVKFQLTDFIDQQTLLDDFQFLMDGIRSAIQMSHYDPNKFTIISTDCSVNNYSGWVIQTPDLDPNIPLQDHDNTVIAMIAGTFTTAQMPMTIVEKEAYAILMMVRTCYYYFINNKTILLTDSEIMYYLLHSEETNLRVGTTNKLRRVIAELAEHNIRVLHIPGLSNLGDLFTRFEYTHDLPVLPLVETVQSLSPLTLDDIYPDNIVDSSDNVISDSNDLPDPLWIASITYPVIAETTLRKSSRNRKPSAIAIQSSNYTNSSKKRNRNITTSTINDDAIPVIQPNNSSNNSTEIIATPSATSEPDDTPSNSDSLSEDTDAAHVHSEDIAEPAVSETIPDDTIVPVTNAAVDTNDLPTAPELPSEQEPDLLPEKPFPALEYPHGGVKQYVRTSNNKFEVKPTYDSDSDTDDSFEVHPDWYNDTDQLDFKAAVTSSQLKAINDGVDPKDKIFYDSTLTLIDDADSIKKFNFDGKLIIWIPFQDKQLILRLMILAHDGISGHFSSRKTLALINDIAIWTNMNTDVNEFCKLCLHCCRSKGPYFARIPYGLQLRGTKRGEVLFMDFLQVGKSRPYKGKIYNYILVIKDSFSGYIDLIPCESCDHKPVVDALIDWYVTLLPWDVLVSDNGSHFIDHVVQHFNKVIGSKQHFAVPHVPRSVSGAEHANSLLMTVFKLLLGEQSLPPEHWIDELPKVKLILNNRRNKDRANYTPKELMMGIPPTSNLSYTFASDVEITHIINKSKIVKSEEYKKAVDALAEELSSKSAITNTAAVEQRNKRNIARSREFGVHALGEFNVGDYCFRGWILNPLTGKPDRPSKLSPNWTGPYIVTKVLDDFHICVSSLRDFPRLGPETVEHIIRLKHYARPKQIEFNDKMKLQCEYSISMFRIEKVVGHRLLNNAMDLRIKWLGLRNSENSYLPIKKAFNISPVEVNNYINQRPQNIKNLLLEHLQ